MAIGTSFNGDNEGASWASAFRAKAPPGACDNCRRKRLHCDWELMPENQCSNCVTHRLVCSHTEKRTSQKHVKDLENRLENARNILRRVRPDIQYDEESGEIRQGIFFETEDGSLAKGKQREDLTSPSSPISRLSLYVTPNPFFVTVAQGGSSTSSNIKSDRDKDRRAYLDIHSLLVPETVDKHGSSGEDWEDDLVIYLRRLKMENLNITDIKNYPYLRRKERWKTRLPWEAPQNEVVNYLFPPDDLLKDLIDRYFVCANSQLPLLHRPKFEKMINDRLYYSDKGFASVVLLVCSIGSRFCDDPRVLIDGRSKHSAGWAYFKQVKLHFRPMREVAQLYEIQAFTLGSMYLIGSSCPQARWNLIGAGIRLAQDAGAHREETYAHPRTIESELWRRAFWILIVLDRTCSASYGRQCAMSDDGIDVELPLEVDDEGWDDSDSGHPPEQPKDKPCEITYFNLLAKLTIIWDLTLRSLYIPNRVKESLGLSSSGWDQRIKLHLESEFNKWIGTIPEHLRDNSRPKNSLFFNQTVLLHIASSYFQILLHRPFIASSSSSMKICINAARACAQVCSIAISRSLHNWTVLFFFHFALFDAALVIVLGLWKARARKSVFVTVKDVELLSECLEVMKLLDQRFLIAGYYYDVITELLSVRRVPTAYSVDLNTTLPKDGEQVRNRVSQLFNPQLAQTASKVTVPAVSGYVAQSDSDSSPEGFENDMEGPGRVPASFGQLLPVFDSFTNKFSRRESGIRLPPLSHLSSQTSASSSNHCGLRSDQYMQESRSGPHLYRSSRMNLAVPLAASSSSPLPVRSSNIDYTPKSLPMDEFDRRTGRE